MEGGRAQGEPADGGRNISATRFRHDKRVNPCHDFTNPGNIREPPNLGRAFINPGMKHNRPEGMKPLAMIPLYCRYILTDKMSYKVKTVLPPFPSLAQKFG